MCETELDEIVQKTFKISYTITSNEEEEMSLHDRDTYFLSIPADKIIDCGLGRASLAGKSYNETFKSRLIDYARFSLSNTEEPSKYSSKMICNLDEFKDTNELNLVCEPPKIMTFYLQYNDYFDAKDDMFPCRKHFVSICPKYFSLHELFIPMSGLRDSISSSQSGNKISQTYNLKAIIGYYGYHYVAFNMCSNGDW
jgi:hypothetical protein